MARRMDIYLKSISSAVFCDLFSEPSTLYPLFPMIQLGVLGLFSSKYTVTF